VLLCLIIRREFGQYYYTPHLLDVFLVFRTGPTTYEWDIRTFKFLEPVIPFPYTKSYLERADNIRIIHPIATTHRTRTDLGKEKNREKKRKGMCRLKEWKEVESEYLSEEDKDLARAPLANDYLLGPHHPHLAHTNRNRR
jgi:hypothetical protein